MIGHLRVPHPLHGSLPNLVEDRLIKPEDDGWGNTCRHRNQIALTLQHRFPDLIRDLQRRLAKAWHGGLDWFQRWRIRPRIKSGE
ncbi:MAG: hypothetical protein COA52_06095 [Hyphomicrobiales bacterium]|nr:MAG: hypothetical protein COA52_06095 [Hyphomicrobiales bacterium]